MLTTAVLIIPWEPRRHELDCGKLL